MQVQQVTSLYEVAAWVKLICPRQRPFWVASICLRLQIARCSIGSKKNLTKGDFSASLSQDGKRGAGELVRNEFLEQELVGAYNLPVLLGRAACVAKASYDLFGYRT